MMLLVCVLVSMVLSIVCMRLRVVLLFVMRVWLSVLIRVFMLIECSLCG